MSVRSIVQIPDPRLRQLSSPIAQVGPDTRSLVADMFDTMYEAGGVGLAAIQIGVPQRILVIDLQKKLDPDGPKRPRVFINPVVLDASKEMSRYAEGCLSVPDRRAEVERPERIRVSWCDLEGYAHEEAIEGLLATCLQHEIDHLNGIVFTDRLDRTAAEETLG